MGPTHDHTSAPLHPSPPLHPPTPLCSGSIPASWSRWSNQTFVIRLLWVPGGLHSASCEGGDLWAIKNGWILQSTAPDRVHETK
jgi:hypothetical protein